MSPTTTHTPTDQWLATHASGIIAYAESDHRFAQTFAASLYHCAPETTSGSSAPAATPALTPLDTEHATAIASWLLGRLQHQRYPQTMGVLTSWAAEVRNRDFIVMGLGGSIIPGLTVGDPSVKKNKRAQLQVVFTADWYASCTAADIVTHTARLSHRTIARELARVGGDSYALHPDTAEWFLNDPTVKCYTTSTAELQELERAAITERVDIERHVKIDRTVALAIAPSVRDTFVDERPVTRLG